ncbi:MAG: amino acid transporter [Dethiosulfovibrio peptidovorans]|nr:MAG: amino acid transporter [Dethiosulfovibrio peptidovorans]
MGGNKLNRNLSFMQMIAISSGAVIGGWLAEAPYWFSTTGAGAGFLFPVLAVLLIPVGLAFGELAAMLPFAAGVDVWTTNAYGNTMGFATQWMMFLIQVVEPPMMAFIFATAINHFYPLSGQAMMFVAIASVTIWFFLSNYNISLTGNLSNFFFFSMVVISILVGMSFLLSGHWSMENITLEKGFFPKGGAGIFIAMAIFSLKFIGFEMTPTLIEETNFPPSKIWKIILAALFIPAILYCFITLAIGGMAPWHQIAEMNMPEPELVDLYGLPKIIGILAIVSGLMHAFTTLMGFWTSSARVLYGAAQLNQLPKSFMKVNRHGQPFFSNVIVYLFSVFFCLFTGENWVQYIYAISCIAAGIVYFIACMDVMRLRRIHPEWPRPFRAPGGTILFVIGLIISIWIIAGSCMELDAGGYLSLVIFFAVGYVIYMVSNHYRRTQNLELVTLTPDDIDKP